MIQSQGIRVARVISLIAAATVLLAVNVLSVQAFSTGPPNGRTGAPGESNCTVLCHSSFPLNSGTGSLTVTGIDTDYIPGNNYTMTVTLADPVAQRWGFELTSLDPANNFAGGLASINGLTQVSIDPLVLDRTYVKHTSAGTSLGTTGSNAWQFDWTAPAEGTGEVTFYVAGNAANGNFFNTGDRIYTRSFSFGEAAGTATPVASAGLRLLPNRPNPFNPATVLAFTLDRGQHVRVTLHDLRGRTVRRLVDGARTAGRWEMTWNGTDDQGRAVVSGTYLVRVQSADGVQTQSIVLAK